MKEGFMEKDKTEFINVTIEFIPNKDCEEILGYICCKEYRIKNLNGKFAFDIEDKDGEKQTVVVGGKLQLMTFSKMITYDVFSEEK